MFTHWGQALEYLPKLLDCAFSRDIVDLLPPWKCDRSMEYVVVFANSSDRENVELNTLSDPLLMVVCVVCVIEPKLELSMIITSDCRWMWL